MGKIVGMILILGGVAGCLHSWIILQKEKQRRIEEIILFLQKTMFVLKTEKVKVVDYFAKYTFKDSQMENQTETVLEISLHKVANRLATNTYPKGQDAWEEVLKEEEQNFAFDKETFGVLLQVGNGFFGRSCEENICFLQKSLEELEKQQEKMKEKDTRERKVWVPVGMLGTVMLLLVFL